MKLFKMLKLQLLLLGVAAFVLYGCKNESSILGLDLHPPTDQPNVRYHRLGGLNTYTVLEDSIKTDNNSLNMLGVISDATFGVTRASFAAHLRTATNNIEFGSNPQVDSIVLFLKPFELFGDSAFQHDIVVRELDEDIYKDSSYYSNRTFSTTGTPIGSYNGIIWKDKADSLDPVVRIKLDNSFGQRIIDESGSANLENPDAFVEFFKGMLVESTSGPGANGGSVVSFDLVSSDSYVGLYYKNDTDTAETKLVISDKSARINLFEHNFTFTEAETHVNDTSLGDQQFYVKSFSGLKGIIELPDLSAWQDSSVLLNRVNLTLPRIESAGSDLDNASTLVLVRLDSTGKVFFLEDQLDNAVLFGGSYSESKSLYNFNITRHVHNVIYGDLPNQRLAVIAAGSAVKHNGTIIGGPSSADPSKELRLEFYYTKP